VKSYPTLDPVIVDRGTFHVDRLLGRPGQVAVHAGKQVSPRDIVARTDNVEKSFTLYLASELGVPTDSLRKYLVKSIGSTVAEGEPIARVRRGLRTAAVRSPAAGTLVQVDDAHGTVTLVASTGSTELPALVSGVVEVVHPGRGVTIQTSGSRVYGIVGIGGEAVGRLVIGSDRHDRELAADQVLPEWEGCVVLAGMTVGVPALNRMRDVGVAAVIVGSLAEGDIRRYISPNSALDAASYWTHHGYGLPEPPSTGPVIIVTEGFGRLQMADPVYEFLANHAGQDVSVSGRTVPGEQLARPEIYIAGDSSVAGGVTDEPEDGRTVRVSDTHRLGSIGLIEGDRFIHITPTGLRQECFNVVFEGGVVERIPAQNIEVLI
jgi:hypothetical protein